MKRQAVDFLLHFCVHHQVKAWSLPPSKQPKPLCMHCFQVIKVNRSEPPHVAHHGRCIGHWLDIRVGSCCELCKLGAHIATSKCDESPFVAHLVAVVGCTENSNAVAIMGYLIAIILHLQSQSLLTGWGYVSQATLHSGGNDMTAVPMPDHMAHWQEWAGEQGQLHQSA